jgi:MFS family permease
MTTTEIGILVAAYPAGVLVAALPSIALVNARGVRTTTIAGLGTLVAATLGFAWSRSPLLLDAARLVQGVGGAVAWAGALAWLTSQADPARRGSAIGGAVSAALIGMVLGPAIGAAASRFGRGAIFSLMAVVMVALALSTPASPEEPVARRDWMRAVMQLFRSTSANLGNGLLLVIGIVNGTVASLVPLLVTHRQGTAVTIAVILMATYLISSVLNASIGRLSDRFGRLLPTVAGLALSSVIIPFLPQIGSLALLAIATIVASSLVSGLWTPTAAMVTDGADPGPSGQSVAVATMNAAWAAGITAGAIIVSRLADAFGFNLPFVLVGGVCFLAALASLVTLRIASAGKEKAWTLV